MKKSFRRYLALSLFGLGMIALPTARLDAEDTARQLAASVTRMNGWLAPSESAQQWRIFLDLNALETQVGQGYRADASVLAQIHQKFLQGAADRHVNFRSVATAMEQHLAQMTAANQQYPSSEYQRENLDGWAEAFRAAVGQLKPMSSAALNQARIATRNEVASLDQYLRERGPLSPEQMVEPLSLSGATEENADPSSLDLTFLLELLANNIQLDWDAEAGQEVGPSILELRRSLRAQIDPLRAYARRDPNPYVSLALMRLDDLDLKLNLGSRENLVDLLTPQVNRLVEALPEWKADGDRLKQIEVVRIVGLLEATQQVPELLAAFKRTYWQNNAQFVVSESLVNRFAARPVQNTQPVNEMILDNQVIGTAHTNGMVEIDFVPNDHQAHFSLHLMGQVQSDNYSPVGPITVYTGSQAQIEARRSVYVNVGGWFEKAPYGSANLGSFFKGTSCGKLIERVAEQQFEIQRDGAQQIAARRAENRMLNEFGRETSDALTNGRAQLSQQRGQANAIKPYRPTAYLVTGEHSLQGFATRYGASQMTAINPAPVSDIATDVAFQVHDSLLNNYLEDELGGKTFTDQDLDRLNAQAEGKAVSGAISDAQDGTVVEDSADDSDGGAREPFEITLDGSRPIDVHFADQTIWVTINIRRFRSQGQSISDVQVKARFKMHHDSENGQAGVRLEQLGDIDAALKDPDDISIDSATILNLIETTINEELQRQRTDRSERGVFLPMNLIDRSKIPALQELEGGQQLDQAQLVLASFDQGWASLGWRLGQGAVQYSLGDQGTIAGPRPSGAVRLPAIASKEAFEAEAAALQAEDAMPNEAPQ